MDETFIKKFAQPFYLKLGINGNRKGDFLGNVKAILPEVNVEVVAKLLGEFNWRTRKVGAFFAAIKNMTEFQEALGNLLLKSEVGGAGKSYCLALAEFNNQKSIDFLNQYLNYYLTQKDLWFDQGDAMGALAYLDSQNGTEELKKHLESWNEFVSNKPNWDLERSIENFECNMKVWKEIKELVS